MKYFPDIPEMPLAPNQRDREREKRERKQETEFYKQTKIPGKILSIIHTTHEWFGFLIILRNHSLIFF